MENRMTSQSCRENQQEKTSPVSSGTVRRSAVWSGVLVSALSVFVFHASVAAQQTESKTVKIPDGTVVTVTITEALSSEKSHQNDPVHGNLVEDIKVGDVIVMAKGAAVIGHVTEAEPKGRWGHSGSLAYSLDYVKAVDGSNVRLRANSSQGGEQSKAALMLGLSGAFKHGKSVDVAKGASLNAYVDGDHEVTLSKSGK